MNTIERSAQQQDRELADFLQMYLAHEGLDWTGTTMTTGTLQDPYAEPDWTGTFEDTDVEVEWVYIDPTEDEDFGCDVVFA